VNVFVDKYVDNFNTYPQDLHRIYTAFPQGYPLTPGKISV